MRARTLGTGTGVSNYTDVTTGAGRDSYLGALRTLPGARGIKCLVSGYRMLETTRRHDELPFDLTSVAADNVAARRLLERGLPMLPRYRALCDYHTPLIPVGPHRALSDPRVEAGHPELYGDIADVSRPGTCVATSWRRCGRSTISAARSAPGT